MNELLIMIELKQKELDKIQNQQNDLWDTIDSINDDIENLCMKAIIDSNILSKFIWELEVRYDQKTNRIYCSLSMIRKIEQNIEQNLKNLFSFIPRDRISDHFDFPITKKVFNKGQRPLQDIYLYFYDGDISICISTSSDINDLFKFIDEQNLKVTVNNLTSTINELKQKEEEIKNTIENLTNIFSTIKESL